MNTPTKVRAKDILKAYKDNNYNAKVALQSVGYKESTASKKSKGIINNALQTVAQEDVLEVVNSSVSPRNKLLQLVKMSEDDVIVEYLKIVKQDKDFTNKLKAMLPLLKTMGVEWNEQATTVNPTLNLTVTKNDTTPIIDKDNILIDIPATPIIEDNTLINDNMANNIEDKGGGGRADVDSVSSFPLSHSSKSDKIDLSDENTPPTDSSSLIGTTDIAPLNTL